MHYLDIWALLPRLSSIGSVSDSFSTYFSVKRKSHWCCEMRTVNVTTIIKSYKFNMKLVELKIVRSLSPKKTEHYEIMKTI